MQVIVCVLAPWVTVACREDHSVHLPDHGLLGHRIEPGGHLPDHLRCPATFWRGVLPWKKDIFKIDQ
jgi:hypothetical protein